MKNMKTTILSAALTGCMLLAGTAQASYGTVDATLNSVTPTADNGGAFNFTRTGGTFGGTLVSNSPVGKFIGICLDAFETIGVPSSHTWTVVDVAAAPIDTGPIMGAAAAANVGRLITRALGGNLANLSSLTSAQVGALQLAIWEVVNDDDVGYNFGSGAFTSNSANVAGALVLLDGTLGSYAVATNLFAMVNKDTQDFLVQTVPIPAAAWLLGSGLLGLFGLARRKTAVATA